MKQILEETGPGTYVRMSWILVNNFNYDELSELGF